MKEEVLRFGRDGALCGILTHAGGPGGDPPGVLLLNAGVVHRVGPNRWHVGLGRALAARGLPTLRFDFSGIGDSGVRRDTLRFERSAVEEARLAMDVLEQRGVAARFVLAGICSGAEVSFKTACADPRVVGAVLINAPRYLEEPSRDLAAAVARRHAASYYWQTSLFKARSWQKALRGRADYGAILRAVSARLGEALALGRRRRAPATGDAAAFERLQARGVRLLVLLSGGDRGWTYLRVVLGDTVAGWSGPGSPRVQRIPGADHTLTSRESQAHVRELILDWVGGLETGRGGAPRALAVSPTGS